MTVVNLDGVSLLPALALGGRIAGSRLAAFFASHHLLFPSRRPLIVDRFAFSTLRAENDMASAAKNQSKEVMKHDAIPPFTV